MSMFDSSGPAVPCPARSRQAGQLGAALSTWRLTALHGQCKANMSTLLPRLHTRTRSIALVPFSIIIIKDVKPERARALCFKMTASTLHSKHCSHTIKTAEGKPLHCAPHCSKAQSDPQRKKQCNKFKNSKDCVGLTFPRKGYLRFWCPVQLHLGSGVWEYLPGSLHCTALHLWVPPAAAPWGCKRHSGESSRTVWRTQPPQPVWGSVYPSIW